MSSMIVNEESFAASLKTMIVLNYMQNYLTIKTHSLGNNNPDGLY